MIINIIFIIIVLIHKTCRRYSCQVSKSDGGLAQYNSKEPNSIVVSVKVFFYSYYWKAKCFTLWILPVSVRCVKTLEAKMYLSACMDVVFSDLYNLNFVIYFAK